MADIYNFSPGPAVLPKDVLKKAADEATASVVSIKTIIKPIKTISNSSY